MLQKVGVFLLNVPHLWQMTSAAGTDLVQRSRRNSGQVARSGATP